MLKSITSISASASLSKNVQNCLISVQAVPDFTILLELLKPLEFSLSRERFPCGRTQLPFYPVWFLAESSRNLFLWREGLSLEHADSFEFWINVVDLVQNRLSQLRDFSEASRSCNPLWSSRPISSGTRECEEEYLEHFLDEFLSISHRVKTMSFVSRAIQEEITGHASDRIVLLKPSLEKGM